MALARALFFGLRPQIVTFEHDAYSAASLLRILPQGKLVRFFSRLGMKCLGYTLVAPNVLTASGKPFEDWWVRNSHASSLDYQKRGDTTVPAHFLASSGLVARYNELRFA